MAGSLRTPGLAGANPEYRGTLWTPTAAWFALVAVVLWTVTIAWATDMGNMPGTMGMSVLSFVVMWGLMMAAMMLPSVAPMVQLYAKTLQGQRRRRLVLFALGYVLVWTASGLVAYGLAYVAGELAGEAPAAAHVAAVVVFAAVGVYQLSPLKYRCLDHCRSPIGHMFHYAAYRGATRDLRAGAHHGAYCLACCWALMVLMIAFGVMNVWAMVGLAIVVAAEKLWSRGEQLARVAGYAALVLAVVVIFEPGIAPGLDPDAMMDMDMDM